MKVMTTARAIRANNITAPIGPNIHKGTLSEGDGPDDVGDEPDGVEDGSGVGDEML